MAEKQPVVIQGRTIHRERHRKPSPLNSPVIHSYDRQTYSRRAYPSSSAYSSPVSLSKLRESRRGEAGILPLRTSDRPRVRPRTRRSSYPYSGKQSTREGLKLNSLMTKTAVSVLIAVVILLLNSINLPFTQAVIEQVRTALTYEYDLDEALGKLKFVGESIPDEFMAVFGQNGKEQENDMEREGFISPVQGEVAYIFGEEVILEPSGSRYKNQGIDIRTTKQAQVYSAADGTVAAVEQHAVYGLSVWIDHGGKIFTFCGRFGEVRVKAGQKVRQGEKLGTVETPYEGDPLLHFQVWMNNTPVDPLDYIRHAGGPDRRKVVQPV